MKKLIILSIFMFVVISCGVDDECISNDDCGEGFVCNIDTGECEPEMTG